MIGSLSWSLLVSLLLSDSYAQETDDSVEQDPVEIEEQASEVEEGPVETEGQAPAEEEVPAEIEVKDSIDSPDLDGEGSIEELLEPVDSPSPASTSSANVVEQGGEQDIATFRQTYKRYSSRMEEFRQETLTIVELKKQDAMDEITKVYDGPLEELREDRTELSVTAVSKFEQFLAKYPTKPQGAEIRIQLADIYFDRAKDKQILEQEELDRRLMEDPDLDTDGLVLVDYSEPVKLYKEIIDMFPKSDVADGALYMYAWCLKEGDSEQFDMDESVKYFQQLVRDYPDSPFSSQANYLVGNYHFNKDENLTAIEYYQRAVDMSEPQGREYTNLYELSLYRLAWTHYRIDEYDTALALFSKLQDYSQRKESDLGAPADTVIEAVQYTAYSFTDLAERNSLETLILPTSVAKDYYEVNGDREYSKKVYAEMGTILRSQERIEEALDVYRYLQERWPYDPDNPKHQMEIAQLYIQDQNEAGYQEAMKVMTEVYAENGEWWNRNRNNPEAQDVARGYIENALREVAINQYGLAYETQEAEDFLLTAEKFQQYLAKFPFAEDYYQIQWYLADAYYNAGDLLKSLGIYRQMVKTTSDHDYGILSQVRDLSFSEKLALDAHAGDWTQLPEGASVVKKEVLKNGSERLIYALGDAQREFIEAYTNIRRVDFAAPIESLRERAAAAEVPEKAEDLNSIADQLETSEEYVSDGIKSWEYNIGMIYNAHGQLDLAREKFNLIIQSYPEELEADYAANEILRSYQAQENWEMVQSEARRLAALSLGPDDNPDKTDYASIEKNASLLIFQDIRELAESLKNAGKTEEASVQFNIAAEGFEQYLLDYPDMKEDTYAQIMGLAAANYRSAGNVEKSTQLLRRYVDMFPSRPESRGILFEIAESHREALELEEAIKYFDILYNQTIGRGIDYPNAINAKYNSAVLKAGLGDYEGAAKGIEAWVNKFPDQADAEQVFFNAGEYWEKVADWKALKFYTSYIRKFGGKDPNRTMLAHYRRIEIYRAQNKEQRLIEGEWRSLMKSYEAMLAQGKDEPLMRKYAAEYETRNIPEILTTFKDIQYSESSMGATRADDEKNGKLIVDMLTVKLPELRETCLGYGEKYKDFDAILAGYYCVASAELFLAQFFLEYPIPDYLDPNAQLIFEEQLENYINPLEEGSIAGLERVLALSKKQELWTEWTTLSLEELSNYDPKSFPPQKQEVRFQTSSLYVPTVGPIYMDQAPGIVPVEQEPEEVDEVTDPNGTPPEGESGENAPETPENTEQEDAAEEPVEDLPSWGDPEAPEEGGEE